LFSEIKKRKQTIKLLQKPIAEKEKAALMSGFTKLIESAREYFLAI
jgi:hypothetical protein